MKIVTFAVDILYDITRQLQEHNGLTVLWYVKQFSQRRVFKTVQEN